MHSALVLAFLVLAQNAPVAPAKPQVRAKGLANSNAAVMIDATGRVRQFTNDAPALAQAHSHTHTNTDRATHMCYTHLDVGPMLS